MMNLVRLSVLLRAYVDFVGKAATFILIPLVLITVWDVFARKLVWIQIFMVENFGRIFESTLLQEMEWHLHTALFVLAFGYAYTHNRHVRVDFLREKMNFRKQAWIEFLGCSFFVIPFTLVIAYFAIIYAHDSYQIGEQSASLVGLSHRWIIKSVMIVGFLFLLMSAVAIWLQLFVVLFGTDKARFELMVLTWPKEAEETEALKQAAE